jgi:hypothetical protein
MFKPIREILPLFPTSAKMRDRMGANAFACSDNPAFAKLSL